MSSEAVAVTYGRFSFPESTGGVVASVIDTEATTEKGQMVMRSAHRAMEQIPIPEHFSKFMVGEREQNQLGNEMIIIANRDQATMRNGQWTHKIGGLPNGTLLNLNVKSNTESQDTILMVSEFAPLIRVISNFPYEPNAITGRMQLFNGRAWLLQPHHLKEFKLKPKPNYALRYMYLNEATDDDLMFLDFDGELTEDQLEPNVDVAQSSKSESVQFVPKREEPRRRFRRRRG